MLCFIKKLMQLLKSDRFSCLSIRSSAASSSLVNQAPQPTPTQQLNYVTSGWGRMSRAEMELRAASRSKISADWSRRSAANVLAQQKCHDMRLSCRLLTLPRHIRSRNLMIQKFQSKEQQGESGSRALLLSANGISPLAVSALWSPRQRRTLADGGLKMQTVWYYREAVRERSLSLIKLQHHASSLPHPPPNRPLAHPQDAAVNWGCRNKQPGCSQKIGLNLLDIVWLMLSGHLSWKSRYIKCCRGMTLSVVRLADFLLGC